MRSQLKLYNRQIDKGISKPILTENILIFFLLMTFIIGIFLHVISEIWIITKKLQCKVENFITVRRNISRAP
mgnify:CR=1 FL=1